MLLLELRFAQSLYHVCRKGSGAQRHLLFKLWVAGIIPAQQGEAITSLRIALCAIIIPQSQKCLYRFDSFYMQNDKKEEPDCEKHINNNRFFSKIIQNYTTLRG